MNNYFYLKVFKNLILNNKYINKNNIIIHKVIKISILMILKKE